MSRHAAPDPEEPTAAPEPAEPARKSLRQRVFTESAAPHLGMLAIVILYALFFVATGGLSNAGAGVPQPITLGLTGSTAAWFGYLIQQGSRKAKGDK